MPPKKNEPSKKNVDKQKQKIVEDKTFGMKNKKGAKQQKFIQQVQKQVTQGNRSAKELEREKQSKEDKKKEKVELNELFKPVLELQKCAKGVDPKSVLCVFFKQGLCAKGDKCKFSHDLTVERKAEKRGIYSDSDKTDGTMDDWDINKLEEVISKKHDADNKGLPPSTIVSCEFLHQIFRYVSTSLKQWKISSMVGFGSARMERHVTTDMPCLLVCLRLQLIVLGFILQRDKKKMEEQKEIISIEDLVEREISGREIFEFDPALVMEALDDDETSGVVDSRIRDDGENEYDGPVRDIDLNMFAIEVLDCEDNDNRTELTGDCAIPGVSEIHENGYNNDDVVIDEELFDETDLADIEAEINELELEA
ncbi:uncharacterized protein DC041_0007528 [Schistosoma bovis]|uniref:C3H1-type domain-containing protein n=1 Tax=Schistosoma bovis TaxID=6184 RepID=A0A430Q9L3_SCHBO|nr:uncharacterized protein DC041_0007528 [Schistosoma bovis]